MTVWWIPIVAACVTSLIALAISIQNRRWVRRDRQTDLEQARIDRQTDARLATTYATAQALYASSAWRIEANFVAVEPLREAVAVLPLEWRIRIDAWLSMHAHMDDSAGWIQRDLIDLLNGEPKPRPLSSCDADRLIYWIALLSEGDRYRQDPVTQDLPTQLFGDDLTLLSDIVGWPCEKLQSGDHLSLARWLILPLEEIEARIAQTLRDRQRQLPLPDPAPSPSR